jgi:periplasmic copper chaperone A
MVMRRVVARTGAAVFGVLVAVLWTAAPASAHVTVSSANATQGGWAKLTFRVPNEKDSATTVKLEVSLPTDKPVASVSTRPVPGWTVQATKTKLDKPIKTDDGEITEVVTKLTWTAAPEAAIKPGQFQEFDVSAGPLPEVDKLVFKALQTYSDGDVVRWIEEPAADGKEAEHPAPVLKLAPKAKDDSHGAGAADAGMKNAAETKATDADARSRADTGLGLGIAATVLSLVGVALGGLALRRRPTRLSPTA